MIRIIKTFFTLLVCLHVFFKKYQVVYFAYSSYDLFFLKKIILSNKNKDFLIVYQKGKNNFNFLNKKKIYNFDLKFLKFIDSKIFVSASTGIKPYIKRENSIYIHVLHSLASLHSIYPVNAFDIYDYILIYSKSQKKESNFINSVNKRFKAKPILAGYSKFDILKVKPNQKFDNTVLVAPSWGTDFIEKSLNKILEVLLKNNYKVILRPHPYYSEKIIKKYVKNFIKDIKIDYSFDASNSINKSSYLISDYSGFAYEFIFTKHRPCLFINTKKKILNKYFDVKKLNSFEILNRNSFGRLIEPRQIEKLDYYFKN
ncbi:CDP-glycerol glycerophosphotransferase family protein, partial [Candidatus Pelagibacter ubique]|nr:CDP-glycerol glycerophosphotransferase family protein [Candidatus Pelagibacter ubique]